MSIQLWMLNLGIPMRNSKPLELLTTYLRVCRNIFCLTFSNGAYLNARVYIFSIIVIKCVFAIDVEWECYDWFRNG